MSSNLSGDEGQRREASVALATVLWQEYSYRHDLIWRLLFRSASAAILLAIAPFTISDFTEQRVGDWIKTLPLVAAVLVIGTTLLLRFEFTLFVPVVRKYETLQDALLFLKAPKRDFFRVAVCAWQILLLIAVSFAAYLAFQLELED